MSKTTVEKFVDDPASFLKSNCVIVAGGSSARQAGPTVFNMVAGNTDVRSRGSILGKMKSRPFWTISISGANGGTPGVGALNQHEFVGYYIPMKQQSDSVANVFGTPPTDGSIKTLITSQLTGCTFGFSNLSGAFVASHLQPVKGVATAQTRQDMQNITQTGMSGSGTLIQKGVDYSDMATVVGQFKDNRWHIYMQRIDWNPGDGTNGFKELKGVTTF